MLGPCGIAPFPLPAHRTGRADFPHPGRRLASPQGPRWTANLGWCLATTPWQVTNLRLEIELSLKSPDTFRCCQAHHQSPILVFFESVPEVRALSSAGITRPQRSYGPVRLPPSPPPIAALEVRPPAGTGLPRLPRPPSQRTVPITPVDRNGCMRRLLPHSARPSPTDRRVGIHNVTDLRPAQTSLALRTAGSLSRPRRPLARGFETASYLTAPLVSYQINRQLSGWYLPPLVFRAVGAYCPLFATNRHRSGVAGTSAADPKRP